MLLPFFFFFLLLQQQLLFLYFTFAPATYALGYPLSPLDPFDSDFSTFSSLLEKRRYDDYQISDGQGGDALELATATLHGPFGVVPYALVPFEVYDHLLNMWESIDYAHVVLFPDAIELAVQRGDSREANALKVGWKKNEVLLRMSQVILSHIRREKDRREGFDSSEDDGEYKLVEI
ncbi:hypothetical protein FRB91_009050, partial [Serendipita sp. 411]